ncbi:UNKNOWN [Stylonychia lemnae]|uniref:Uncharacterized protein n=1 Tax=Stylonychia lemnae TaxID=5949 RepID=A0A078AHG2_STYLE|nr:UNKNOWN [Stylonychia lemnae]|eukprot:CDW81689.1 UNKNOWN [Stylonychia lemnae]
MIFQEKEKGHIVDLMKSGDFYILYVDSDNQRMRIDKGVVAGRTIQFQWRQINDFQNHYSLHEDSIKGNCIKDSIRKTIDLQYMIQNAFSEENPYVTYFGIVSLEFDSHKNYHKFIFNIQDIASTFEVYINPQTLMIQWSILRNGNLEVIEIYNHEDIFKREQFFEREFKLDSCISKNINLQI